MNNYFIQNIIDNKIACFSEIITKFSLVDFEQIDFDTLKKEIIDGSEEDKKINIAKDNERVELTFDRFYNISFSKVAFILNVIREKYCNHIIEIKFKMCLFSDKLEFTSICNYNISKISFEKTIFNNYITFKNFNFCEIQFKSVTFTRSIILNDASFEKFEILNGYFFDQIKIVECNFNGSFVFKNNIFIPYFFNNCEDELVSKFSSRASNYNGLLNFIDNSGFNEYLFVNNKYNSSFFSFNDLRFNSFTFKHDIFNDHLKLMFDLECIMNSMENYGKLIFSNVVSYSIIEFFVSESKIHDINELKLDDYITKKDVEIKLTQIIQKFNIECNMLKGIDPFELVKNFKINLSFENRDLIEQEITDLKYISKLGNEKLINLFEKNKFFYECKKVENELINKSLLIDKKQKKCSKLFLSNLKYYFKLLFRKIFNFFSKMSNYGTSPLKLIAHMLLIIIFFSVVYLIYGKCFIDNYCFLEAFQNSCEAFTACGFIDEFTPYFIIQVFEAVLGIFLNGYLVSVVTAMAVRSIK